MKRRKPIALWCLALIAITMVSCSKDEVKPFLGDYTYNTSGTIVLNMSGIPLQLSVPNNTGQMHIISIDEDDRVMIQKTSLAGTVSVGYATIDDDEITFEPVTTTEAVFTGQQYLTATITSTGNGKIYDGKTIVINEKYTGSFAGMGSDINAAGTLSGDSILTVAERNEE